VKTIFVLLLIASCIMPDVGQGQATSRPFTIAISAEDSVVKAGSDVYLTIRMTNTSKHDLDCSVSDNSMLGMDVKYQYDVRDNTSNLVREKVFKHPELATGHFRLCTIKPGETATSGGNLITKRFDLSRPGEYIVQVSRAVSDNPKDGIVKSNAITITVSP
jgi:hypothetical protein